MTMRLPKITFWGAVATVLLAAGVVSAVLRYWKGLGAVTNLSDEFPWGMWIGFDVLCGVALAAGGFTLAALTHILHIKRFEPIVRPAILTAFLGYLLVVGALMVDLGRPWNIWHALVMWNPNSVMFEIAWCVMLYTTVLALEFAPMVLERFRWVGALKVLRNVMVPIIILGVLLSTLHQSSLGSMYLIMPEKVYPLWYSPYLPVFFFVSAIAVGLAMTIFESFLSSRAFGRGLEMNLLTELGRICLVVLAVLATMKVLDLAYRNQWGLLFAPRGETWFWWAEVSVGLVAPILLLAQRRIREHPNGLFASAFLVILGVVLNRMNVSITSLEAYAGKTYFPSLAEISLTLSIVAFGFVAFALAARHLPVFAHHGESPEVAAGEAARRHIARELQLASQGS